MSRLTPLSVWEIKTGEGERTHCKKEFILFNILNYMKGNSALKQTIISLSFHWMHWTYIYIFLNLIIQIHKLPGWPEYWCPNCKQQSHKPLQHLLQPTKQSSVGYFPYFISLLFSKSIFSFARNKILVRKSFNSFLNVCIFKCLK